MKFHEYLTDENLRKLLQASNTRSILLDNVDIENLAVRLGKIDPNLRSTLASLQTAMNAAEKIDKLLAHISKREGALKDFFDVLYHQEPNVYNAINPEVNQTTGTIHPTYEANKEETSQNSSTVSLKPIRHTKIANPWNATLRSPVFIGRDKLLDELFSKFDSSAHITPTPAEATQIRVVLTGLGGIGKTQLALEFAYSSVNDFTHVFWINAQRSDTIQLAYRKLVTELQLCPGDELANCTNAALTWLSVNRGWLLILDDATDYESVEPFIPRTGGDVLITSRSTNWYDDVIEICAFTHNECLQYLAKVIGTVDEPFVTQLTISFGNLPLALAQAAYYIKNHHITLRRYIELLDMHKVVLLMKQALPDRKLKSVFTVWDVSLDAVQMESPLGMTLLNLCAYLDGSAIPNTLLQQLSLECQHKHSKELYEDALGVLNAFSLVITCASNGHTVLHPLVQDVIRLRHSEAEFTQYAKWICGAFASIWPKTKQTVSHFTVMRTLLPSITAYTKYIPCKTNHKGLTDNFKSVLLLACDGCKSFGIYPTLLSLLENIISLQLQQNENQQCNSIKVDIGSHGSNLLPETTETANLLASLGTAYGGLGRYDDQRSVLERALQVHEICGTNDTEVIAAIMGDLGSAYGYLGKPKMALDTLEKALNVLVSSKRDSPSYFTIAKNLSGAYIFVGEYEKALKLLLSTKEQAEKYFTHDHPQIGDLLSNLGWTYECLCDHESSAKALEKALTIKEQHFGPHHPEIATILTNMGRTCVSLGQHLRAKSLLETALAIKENYFGKDHAEVAITLTNLGAAYACLGDDSGKLTSYRKALEIFEKCYGYDHPEVSYALGNMGNAYQSQGDYANAKDVLQKALVSTEQYFGDSHLRVSNILGSLGWVHTCLGKYDEGCHLLERALDIRIMHLGPNHVDVAFILNNLGWSYQCQGNYNKGRATLEKALEIRERHFGLDHTAVAVTLNNLGWCVERLGDYTRACSLFERALRIQEAAYGMEHKSVGTTMNNLGNAYIGCCKYEEACDYLTRSVAIKENKFGSDHVDVAIPLNNLGKALECSGQYEKARELLERALKIAEHYFEPGHHVTASVLNNLGSTIGFLGDYWRQFKLLQTALDIRIQRLGNDHSEVAHTLHNLAIAFGSLRENEKAIDSLNKSLEIRQKYYGDNHVKVASTMAELGAVHLRSDNPILAIEYLEKALAFQQRYLSDDHVDVARTMNYLAKAYGHTGADLKERDYLEKALAIRRNKFDDNHILVVTTLSDLIGSYLKQEDYKRAQDLLGKVLAAHENWFGADHPGLLPVLQNCIAFYCKTGEKNAETAAKERTYKIIEKYFDASK